MTAPRWMIYGANGYTGALIAAEAVRRGHAPVLAGRTLDKVRAVAEPLGLGAVAFALDDPGGIRQGLTDIDLVVHAAGPFVFTSAPMLDACLAVGAHYVDITGEIPVFANSFDHDAEARARAIAVISGVGFDVVPTDCLARHVADQLPGATTLEIAISGGGSPSAGTTKSALEQMRNGNKVRRNGVMETVPFGYDARRVRFHDRSRSVVSIPWGDLETAYRSTGIANITTYMAQPRFVSGLTRVGSGIVSGLLGIPAVRGAATRVVERRMTGPGADTRVRARSHVWARATDNAGRTCEAWLETMEGYRFTALATVRAVEAVFEHEPVGALTPAMAFGADFVLSLPETARYDALA